LAASTSSRKIASSSWIALRPDERRMALRSGPESMLTQVLTASAELLDEAKRTIRPESFADAVKLIHTARETLVLGIGAPGIFGEYLALRPTRLRARLRGQGGRQRRPDHRHSRRGPRRPGDGQHLRAGRRHLPSVWAR
jgi:hypothetical protein